MRLWKKFATATLGSVTAAAAALALTGPARVGGDDRHPEQHNQRQVRDAVGPQFAQPQNGCRGFSTARSSDACVEPRLRLTFGRPGKSTVRFPRQLNPPLERRRYSPRPEKGVGGSTVARPAGTSNSKALEGPVAATDREISNTPCFSSIVAVNLAGREGLFFIATNSRPP